MAKRSTAPTKRRGASKSSTAKRKRTTPVVRSVIVEIEDWGPIDPSETDELDRRLEACGTPAERIAVTAELTARTLDIVHCLCRDLAPPRKGDRHINPHTARECIGPRLRDLLVLGRALWREIMHNQPTVDLLERGGFRVGNIRSHKSSACVATALAAADVLEGGSLRLSPEDDWSRLFDGFDKPVLRVNPADVRDYFEGTDFGALASMIRAELRGALDSTALLRSAESKAESAERPGRFWPNDKVRQKRAKALYVIDKAAQEDNHLKNLEDVVAAISSTFDDATGFGDDRPLRGCKDDYEKRRGLGYVLRPGDPKARPLVGRAFLAKIDFRGRMKR